MAATVGSLNVDLTIGTARFKRGLSDAQKQINDMRGKFQAVGAKLQSVGAGLSLGLTAPIAAAAAGVVKMSADFETSMNAVQISTQAGGAEMKAMSALALQLGKDTTFSASTSADAMDMLAKNGLTAKEILGGAAKAALDLASATGSQLDPAAAAITDTLQQFKLKTSDLPTIVNQITGAVNASKLDFVDFQGAAAQAGGVAANVGVQFKDFTAVLAGISPLFASGSDAGTSFKTFLASLGNPTSKASAEITKLGLSFYDAAGNLRPMSDIAEQLRQKIGGLSDQAKTQSLATIFGSDGIRAALGLMQLGAKGLDDIKQKIGETDAAAQSAARLKGFNGQLEQLKGSVETLAIAIGQSGMLEALTGLVATTADFIGKLSELDPTVLRVGTVIAALTAAIGPVLVALGSIANAVGVLAPIFIRFGGVLTTTVLPVLAGLGRALVGLAVAGGPLTLLAAAATAGYLVWKNWDTIGPIVGRMVSAVKTWLVDKLGPVFKWVTDKVNGVKDTFFKMYDAVVGHSYVPDMVDGIAQHFGRLDAEMVAPANKAVAAVNAAFAGMQTQAIANLPTMTTGGVSVETTDQPTSTVARPGLGTLALGALKSELGELASTGAGTFDQLARGILDKVIPAAEQGTEAFASMTDGLGSLGDKFTGLFGQIFGTKGVGGAISRVLGTLAGSFVQSRVGGASLGGLPGRDKGGAVTAGKSYWVGERRPEIFTPSVSGRIIANDDIEMGSRGTTIQQHFNVPVGSAIVTRDEMYQFGGAVKASTMSAITQAQRRKG